MGIAVRHSGATTINNKKNGMIFDRIIKKTFAFNGFLKKGDMLQTHMVGLLNAYSIERVCYKVKRVWGGKFFICK